MTNDLRKKALNAFLGRVKDKFNTMIVKIILFGSYARGEVREDSDIDLLIITRGKRFETQKILTGIAIDILLETEVYISVKVVTTEEYDFMRNVNTGFYQHLAREGISVG